MGKLIYSMQVSADGYVNNIRGGFEWAAPDDDVLEYILERMQGVSAYVYGRRYYETMTSWADLRSVPGLKELDYRFSDLWNATPKYVYSTTLTEARTPNTTFLREFDPVFLRGLADSGEKHVTVEGTTIAAQALRAGLIDGVSIYYVPIATGGGTPFWPADVPLRLRLIDEQRFESGIVNVRYAPIY